MGLVSFTNRVVSVTPSDPSEERKISIDDERSFFFDMTQIAKRGKIAWTFMQLVVQILDGKSQHLGEEGINP